MSIIIKNLSFAYGEKRVLDDLSLTVQSGESAGVIGVSGGGKSTLLKLVSGLYDVQTGEIELDGYTSSADRRRSVAIVMQSPMLFPASIRDNITCGHDMTDSAVWDACRAAQISDWIESLPDGLASFVGERGGNVSGGQAQRIAIARAIAKNAPVILLDEPTSALDEETGAALMKALEVLVKGKTVLHVSHRPETLTNCTSIYRLENGKLSALKEG